MTHNSILKQLTYVKKTDVEKTLDKLVNTNTPITVGFLNQHGYNLLCQFYNIKNDFLSLDYIFRDGIGIKLACQLSGIEAGANMNGTDLIPRILHHINLQHIKSLFFAYGTQSPWLEIGAEKLFSGEIFLKLDGFHAENRYLEHYKLNQRNDILNVVVLAMGMPKQEAIAWRLKELSQGAAIIICGGAILDFKAGRFRRAPEIFRKTGMEWLFRLSVEPRRLFSRYIIGIPKFFYYTLKYEK